MAHMPVDRVRKALVFEICAVDFVEQMFLLGDEKAWICIFTSAVFCAVHLELIVSLFTEAFLQALRRLLLKEEDHPLSTVIMVPTLEELRVL